MTGLTRLASTTASPFILSMQNLLFTLIFTIFLLFRTASTTLTARTIIIFIFIKLHFQFF